MNVGHLAPEIALVVGAVTALLTASFTSPRRQWLGAALAGVATLASAVITIGLAVTTESQLTFERSWALDPVTHASELIILGATGCCLLLVPEWFRTDARRGELPAIVLFAATGAMLLAGAADTMEIVVGVLLVSVTGYTLAAFHRGSPAAVEAGMKYFLVGALANAILLVGVVILYGSAGSTNLADIGVRLRGGGDRVALTAAVVCIVIGLAFEIGAAPVHTWVPDVAQAGPVPSAAFLTVVPKVGAVVALARVVHVMPDDAVAWRPVVAVVAGVTMTLGNLMALWQDDLRRLLGWSTVSQAGYALIAVVVVDRSDAAPMALVAFLAAYSAANVAAFGVVAELRGRTHLTGYRGLAGTHPWLALSLALSLLSLVGIPPLGGFVGKLTLFTAAIDGGYGWLAALAVANTVVSLFYYLRVIGPMYFDRAERPVPVLGRAAAVGAGLATLAVVALGVAAEPMLSGLDGVHLLP